MSLAFSYFFSWHSRFYLESDNQFNTATAIFRDFSRQLLTKLCPPQNCCCQAASHEAHHGMEASRHHFVFFWPLPGLRLAIFSHIPDCAITCHPRQHLTNMNAGSIFRASGALRTKPTPLMEA